MNRFAWMSALCLALVLGCGRATPPLLGRWRSVPAEARSDAPLLAFEFEFSHNGGTIFTVVTPNERHETLGRWKLLRREGNLYHLEVVQGDERRSSTLAIRVLDPQTFELADDQGRYHRYAKAPQLAAR